jgi:ssDNA thymidine ADP-ribosyltransferase, DarT
VMLVSTLGTVDSPVLTDGDAAGSLVRFATTLDDTERMLRRLHDTEDAVLDAEALVPGTVPFDSITLIGVANNKVRDQVRELLDESHFAPKVAVYPPWFARL